MQQMMKRHEVPLELTWKIEDLFKTEEDFQKSSEEVFLLAQQFENDYKGQPSIRTPVLRFQITAAGFRSTFIRPKGFPRWKSC